jgi:hypothetical protein
MQLRLDGDQNDMSGGQESELGRDTAREAPGDVQTAVGPLGPPPRAGLS